MSSRKVQIAAIVGVLAIISSVVTIEFYPMWSADRHLNRAKRALVNYDFPTAESELRKTLAIRADHNEASYLLAQVYRRTNRYTEAKTQLAEAKKIGWIDEYLQLEQMLSNVQERGPYTGDAATVRLYIDAAHPEDRLLFEAMVVGYLNAHLIPDAANLLDKWCNRYPDDWYPHFQRGIVRESIRSLDGALADFRFVMAKHPEHATVRRRIADIHLELRKDLDEAQKLYEGQLQRTPDDSDAEAGLAATFDLLGKGEEAIRHADASLQLQPNATRSLLLKSRLIRSKDPTLAYELALKAEAQRNDDAAIPLLLGQLAGELGIPAEASKHLERHRFLDGQWKQLNDFSEAVRMNPHDPEIRCQIGIGMIAIGRVDDGELWFHSALNEDPKCQHAHELLADAYARRGAAERAKYHRILAKALAKKKS